MGNSEPDWYSVVSGRQLEQGDLLRQCPVPLLSGLRAPVSDDAALSLELADTDVVVLSQTCDLVNDKLTEVLVAEVITWEEAMVKEPFLQSTDIRKAVRQGNMPSISLLNKRADDPPFKWSIVDFRRLHVLPKVYVGDVAVQAGPRLRLNSPYKEHLAQAFARYFMRVGLPHDVGDFLNEGKPRK